MLLLLFFLSLAVCAAQPWPQPPGDIGKLSLPAQTIGPDDLIALSVYRSPELTRMVRVDPGGLLALPLLAQPVRAAGLLPSQLEVAIAEALRREGILVNPIVSVAVAEYASRPIRVVGAVRKPVTFQAAGPVTLLDALARAEGLAPDAALEILLTRPPAAPLRISVDRLIDAADPDANLPLYGGEEIRVPEAPRFFVLGNVKRPGSYSIRDPTDASFLKLLAFAEGLAPYAGKLAYIYRNRTEIPVPLEDILDRKAQDVPLLPNDVLYVPDNKGRRVAISVIDRITSFSAATVSGVLIWRR